MKKKLHLICLLVLVCASIYSQQVGIGTTTPDSSAQLEISNTAKGILIPRMSTGAINNIVHPAKSLMVYDTTKNELMVNMGTKTAPNWKTIANNSSWNLKGNAGTNASSHFIGTTDNVPLTFRMNNKMAGRIDSVTFNTYLGYQAGRTTNGSYNTAIGTKSLFSNTTGHSNIALGTYALQFNTTGINNTALGNSASSSNTTGSFNTSIGSALSFNVSGNYNVAIGYSSLRDNTGSSKNIAIGYSAMKSHVSGDQNVAMGFEALSWAGSSVSNTAVGHAALRQNVSGSHNSAYGENALTLNNAGSYNTALGKESLWANNNASYNTALGYRAGYSFFPGWNNTLIGAECNITANGIFNSVGLGNGTVVTASNQTRIGNSSTTSTGGYTGWTNISDGRFKKDIREDVKGLPFIMKLRPVTYHLDVTGLRNALKESGKNLKESGMETAIAEKESMVQSGFIAQEVEQAAMELRYDFSGVDKPKNENDFYGLRYAEFVVPLVKAMQEQQLLIEELHKENMELRARMEGIESGIRVK